MACHIRKIMDMCIDICAGMYIGICTENSCVHACRLLLLHFWQRTTRPCKVRVAGLQKKKERGYQSIYCPRYGRIPSHT